MSQSTTPGRVAAALRLAAGLCLVWLALGAAGAQAAGNRLTAVDASAAGGHGVRIRLTLDSAAPVPSVFTVDQPARLSIDLPNTSLAVDPRYQRIDKGPVQAVATAASGQRTRVVVELASMVDYNVQRQGNQIIVDLGGRGARPSTQRTASGGASARATRAADQSAGARAAATDSRTAPSGPAVTNIDFRRGEKGAGRVEISLSGVRAPVSVEQTGDKVVADIPGAALPPRLRERLDVLDFATPVKTVDALRRDGGTRIVVTPVSGADFEQVAYQTGDQFFIELQPLSASEKANKERANPQYTGEKISLSFQNIEIRAVLQIIADVADVNMVVSDSVQGTIALRLQDVPWDQALDIIMNAKGLGMRRVNNVITVAPLAEIAAREAAELKARQATRNLAPLRSEIIQINYAQAADIANLLRADSSASAPAPAGPIGQPGVRPSNSDLSLLSARGQVTVDQRTNSLLINETAEKLGQIRQLIKRLDIPVRQVLIESRVVTANRSFSRNLGVTQKTNNLPDVGNFLTKTGYTLSLPAAAINNTNPAQLTTSIIGGAFNLDLALSALESEDRGEVISSPRVITADGQEASIEQGREIPYSQGGNNSTQPTTVAFKKAVLSLTVTPKITPDDSVIMNLKVTQDDVGKFVPTSSGGRVPSIDTRSVTTHVLVDDGDTVVLGGVFEKTDRNQANRVPILSEIPLLGALFKGTQKTRDKRELLIFVTPKILRQKLSLQ